jgi:general secretion pathway protein J
VRRHSGGFTLIELLVALFIAAILFALGYGAIIQALKSHDTLKEQQASIIALQTVVRLMEQDLVQAAPRPVRQPIGSGSQGAFIGSPPDAQPVIALTRAGWSNPAGVQRPGLQRVAYFLENKTLRREYWNVLDPTQTSTTVKRDLMQKVKSFSVRYLDVSRQWQSQWPPASGCPSCATEAQTLMQRPLAVEITLDTEDWGKIVRVIEVPG